MLFPENFFTRYVTGISTLYTSVNDRNFCWCVVGTQRVETFFDQNYFHSYNNNLTTPFFFFQTINIQVLISPVLFSRFTPINFTCKIKLTLWPSYTCNIYMCVSVYLISTTLFISVFHTKWLLFSHVPLGKAWTLKNLMLLL